MYLFLIPISFSFSSFHLTFILMLREPSPDLLASFYNLSTLTPHDKSDLNLSTDEYVDFDQVPLLTSEQQFDILNKLVKAPIGGGEESYIYTNRDLEDPLRGKGSSVVDDLVRKHIINGANDPELAHYLISSQKFNSKQFLTTVHSDTTMEELTQLLRFLEKSIASQKSELRGVIDANYIKFIDCKKSIDRVLVDFKESKSIGQTERANLKVFNPQRHQLVNKHDTLLLELEEAIGNLNTTSALMIRPILDNKARENKLTTLTEFVKAHKFFFDLPSKLAAYLKDRNRDGNQDRFMDEYGRFLEERQTFLQHHRKKYEEKKQNAETEAAVAAADTEYALTTTALTRVFEEVERMAELYREIAFKELLSLDHVATTGPQTLRLGKSAAGVTNAKFMALVEKLHQMDSGEVNPIHDFLANQLERVADELDVQISKFDAKFGFMQERLTDYVLLLPALRANGSLVRYIGEKYRSVEDYFAASQALGLPSARDRPQLVAEVFDNGANLDLLIINEAWTVLSNFVGYLDGMMGENMLRYCNNYRHYYGYEVDEDGVLRDRFFALVEKVTHVLVVLFEDETGDNNQLESLPKNYRQFLPSYANLLSAVHYLTAVNKRINSFMTTLGAAVAKVGSLGENKLGGYSPDKMIKHLRNTLSKVNQKILEAVCAVWVNDCSQLYDLEDWEVSTVFGQHDGPSHTKLINVIRFYQEYVLGKLHELVHCESAGEVRVVNAHASKRMLVSIEIQFMRSLNIIVDAVMKRYMMERDEHEGSKPKKFASSNTLYKVLAMNNFDELSNKTYPRLIETFDRLFDTNLADQKLKLFVDIEKASLTIFEDILGREKQWINERVVRHFAGAHSTIVRVDAYIYEILIHFVKLVHTVKPLTGSEIFISIIDELQQSCLKSILDQARVAQMLDVEAANIRVATRFFVQVFEHSSLRLSEQAVKIASKLVGSEESMEEENVLIRNLEDSKNQFDCF